MRHQKTNKALKIMFELGLILEDDDQVFIEGLTFKKDYPEGVVPYDNLHLFIHFQNDDTISKKIHKIIGLKNYSHHCLYRKEDINQPDIKSHIQLAFKL